MKLNYRGMPKILHIYSYYFKNENAVKANKFVKFETAFGIVQENYV